MNQDYAVKKAADCICCLPASLGAQAGQHTDKEAAKIKRVIAEKVTYFSIWLDSILS